MTRDWQFGGSAFLACKKQSIASFQTLSHFLQHGLAAMAAPIVTIVNVVIAVVVGLQHSWL